MSLSSYSAPSVASPVLSSVSQILGSNSPIGGIVGTAINVLQALGVTVKGKTSHLSYDAVMPKAVDFSVNMVKAFEKAYTPAEIAGIKNMVPRRFVAAMAERWGYGDGLNASIYTSVLASPNRTDALSNQFGLFFLWVGTNVDAESADEFRIVFDAYFSGIFLAAISDANLSASKLRGTVPVPDPVTGGTVTQPGTTTEEENPQQKAGFSSLLMLAGVAGAVWYAMKKGR